MKIEVDSSRSPIQPLYRKKSTNDLGDGAARPLRYNGIFISGSERMSKEKKIEKLSDMLKATDTKAEFNIVEDLEELQRLFGILKSRDYRKKLSALVEKYKSTEITVIREALLDRCQKGDINAIRLYCDYFKASDTVPAENDSLMNALLAKGQEVFGDGN